MNTKILETLHAINEKTSRKKSKSLEQLKLDYQEELKLMSEIFEISILESLFLTSIIISNTDQKICDIDDIAFQLEISKFIIFQNLSAIYSLEEKELIEIFEIDRDFIPKSRYISFAYPIEILNKNFRITKNLENLIFDQTS